jgi:hypothetical protein
MPNGFYSDGSYDGTPPQRMRTGDLRRARDSLLRSIGNARSEMNRRVTAAGMDMAAKREALDAWRPVIAVHEDELKVVTAELNRRDQQAAKPRPPAKGR